MGTFGRHRPRSATMRTLRRLLAWRLDVAHVPPHSRARMVSAGGDNTRYRRGRAVRLPVISPHRATGYTECPGKRVVRRLPRLRDAVAKTGLPKIYRPTISPDGVRLGGARDPVIEARATHKLVWTVAVRERGGAPIASFPDRIDDRLRIVWSDGGSHPHPFAPGKYEVIIQGERPRGGKKARGASLPFTVKDR
jgi:hypothetical protein